MDKLIALFEVEITKRVAIESKIIKDEYISLLKKAKEEFREEVINHKSDNKDATKKIIDELKEEHQKQKSIHQNELRIIKEEQKQSMKNKKDEIVEERKQYIDKARSIHSSYSDYLQVIASNYAIPYKFLLRDAPLEDDNVCRGLKKNMSRCNLGAKYDGYCKHHHSQLVRRHTIELIDDTSTIPTVELESKGLIDFNSVL